MSNAFANLIGSVFKIYPLVITPTTTTLLRAVAVIYHDHSCNLLTGLILPLDSLFSIQRSAGSFQHYSCRCVMQLLKIAQWLSCHSESFVTEAYEVLCHLSPCNLSVLIYPHFPSFSSPAILASLISTKKNIISFSLCLKSSSKCYRHV